MREAYEPLRRRVDGLTDDEFFWEPVAGAWTVRRRSDGRWDADYAEPDPDPPPFTTVGWRLVHVATCKVIYHDYAFGPAQMSWATLDHPHTADQTITMLEEGHRLLTEDLAHLDDAGLDATVPTNWGERWPAWRIFWTMIDHDSHHGGEIGVLRDLYRLRDRARPPASEGLVPTAITTSRKSLNRSGNRSRNTPALGYGTAARSRPRPSREGTDRSPSPPARPGSRRSSS